MGRRRLSKIRRFYESAAVSQKKESTDENYYRFMGDRLVRPPLAMAQAVDTPALNRIRQRFDIVSLDPLALSDTPGRRPVSTRPSIMSLSPCRINKNVVIPDPFSFIRSPAQFDHSFASGQESLVAAVVAIAHVEGQVFPMAVPSGKKFTVGG